MQRILGESPEIVEVALTGRLDAYSSETMKTQLHQAVGETRSYVLVNLSEVYFIDSAGLSALVSGLRLARENDKDVVLVGLNKQAKMVFRLTMLDRIFAVYSTVAEATESLSS